jgi:hypothetical protein
MTEMIARDLQDMREHPVQTALALICTLLIVLACAIGCGAFLAVVLNLGVLL